MNKKVFVIVCNMLAAAGFAIVSYGDFCNGKIAHGVLFAVLTAAQLISGIINIRAYKNSKTPIVSLRCLRQRTFFHTIAVTTERKEVITMLNENIKTIRRSKGLSQEELAVKLNVVRQTVSKWEQGLSVPDADLLIALSDALDTPVSALLGETVAEPQADDLKAIGEKLEVLNLQLSQRTAAKRKTLYALFVALCAVIVVLSVGLILLHSPYLGWNFADPETAVLGTAFHAFEWLFVRLAPIVFVGSVVGAVCTRRKDSSM